MKIELIVSGRIDVVHHVSSAVDPAAIVAAIAQAKDEIMDTVASGIATLQSDIEAETTVEQSAITLLNGIPAIVAKALSDAGINDTANAAAVASLDATIKANMASLSAAVTANTPAAPPAPPTLAITNPTITGTAGDALTGSFTVADGAAPFSFAADANWPADIDLNSTGGYSGTPSAEAVSSVVTVTDASGASGETTVSISIA